MEAKPDLHLNDQAIVMKHRLADTVTNFKSKVEQTLNRQQDDSNKKFAAMVVNGLKKEAGVLNMLKPDGDASGAQDGDGQEKKPAGFLKKSIGSKIIGDGPDEDDLDDTMPPQKGSAATAPSASAEDEKPKGWFSSMFGHKKKEIAPKMA